MPETAEGADRFRIEGNRLVVTSQFDPRFQRGAEGELLTTLDGMLAERQDGTVVLDLHNRDSLPSMLVGIIFEAHRRVMSQNRTLLLVVRPDHLKSLQWVGLQRIFSEDTRGTDENGITFIQFESKPLLEN